MANRYNQKQFLDSKGIKAFGDLNAASGFAEGGGATQSPDILAGFKEPLDGRIGLGQSVNRQGYIYRPLQIRLERITHSLVHVLIKCRISERQIKLSVKVGTWISYFES